MTPTHRQGRPADRAGREPRPRPHGRQQIRLLPRRADQPGRAGVCPSSRPGRSRKPASCGPPRPSCRPRTASTDIHWRTLMVTRYGTSSNDDLFGGTGSDTLSGLGGDDRVFAYGGNDFVYGGTGDDILYGGFGNDLI